jgi:hypothetical protein
MYLHFVTREHSALAEFLFLLSHNMDKECLSNNSSISCCSSSITSATAQTKVPTGRVIHDAITGKGIGGGTLQSILLKKDYPHATALAL